MLTAIHKRIPAAGLREQPSGPALNEPPYRGLWPYREEHAPLFYCYEVIEDTAIYETPAGPERGPSPKAT